MPPAPTPPEEGPAALVPVLTIAESAMLPVVKSVLESAGIAYVVQGEEGMALLPVGGLAKGMIRRAFSCVVHVAQPDLEAAREVLREVT